jgi:hypothetical protein
VHVVAGKPEGEPTESYVKGAAKTIGVCLEKYMAQGNEIKGRNLTMDRGYTSYDVVKDLGDRFNITVIGTICASRKGLPKHFRDPRGREVGDYQVLYDTASDISIHSEIGKKKSGQLKKLLIDLLSFDSQIQRGVKF